MTEREARGLVTLNDEGVHALDNLYRSTLVSTAMINNWAEQGILRVSFPDGALTVKVYKKYVTQARKLKNVA